MAETREKITFLVSKEQKEKLIQYINISDDKGITDFILSAMEFYGGYCMTSQTAHWKCTLFSLLLSYLLHNCT